MLTRRQNRTLVSRRLFLEPLETRAVPATFNWVAGVPGDWDVAANWRDQDNQPGIPGAGDHANFQEVVTSSVSRTVNSVNSGFGGLHVTGGTFTLTHTVGTGSSVPGLVVDSDAAFRVTGEQADLFNSEIAGTLISQGANTTIRFARQEDLKAGSQLTGTGRFWIKGDGSGGPTVNVETGTVTVTARLQITDSLLTGPGTLLVGGSFLWEGGTMSGSGQTIVQAGVNLDITSGVALSERTLINNGAIKFVGVGNVDVQNYGTIDNRNTFEIATDRSVTGAFPTATLINSGTITKTTNSGSAALALIFNNTGTVDVQTGTLSLRSGLTDGATYIVAASSTLELAAGGSNTFKGTTSFQGAGSVVAGNGDVVAHGAGASFVIGANLTFNLAGSRLIVPTDAVLNLNGLVTVPGSSNYIIRGGGTVNLNGSARHTGTGNLQLGNDLVTDTIPTTLVIPVGKTYNIFKDAGIQPNAAIGGVIVNRGVLRKSAGAGTSAITAKLENRGTLMSTAGTLAVHRVEGFAGTINTGVGAVVSLGVTSSSVFTQQGALNLTGSGKVALPGGVLEAGNLGATFQVGAGVTFDWSGGFLNVPSGEVMNINGNFQQSADSTVVLFGGGTLNFNGNVLQSGEGNLKIEGGGGNATTVNIAAGKTYDFAADSGFEQGTNNGGVINNLGVIRKTGGVGVSAITTELTKAANMTVSTGTLTLKPATGVVQGGTFTVAAGAILDLASNGTTTMSGTFTGGGAGEVRLAGGGIKAEGGGSGLVFNFPNGLLKINAGSINTNALDVRVKGAMALVGASSSLLTGGGNLIVEGTLTHSTTGALTVTGATTLNIAVGGSYNITSDGDILLHNEGGTLDIDGTLRKSNGSGNSLINVLVTNSGTVEARRGTLEFAAGRISDIVGGSLNAGSWNAVGTAITTATLNLGANVTNIGLAAKVALNGVNSSIPSVANLASIQGSFSLLNGANFANSGDLQNNGKLLLSKTSTLDVSGNYSQGPLGQVTYQGSGTSIGRIRTLNDVNLSGKLLVSFSGAQPAVGTVLTIIENQGGNTITSRFTGLAQNATFAANGMTFRITYGVHVRLTRIA